jgi:acetyl esterase
VTHANARYLNGCSGCVNDCDERGNHLRSCLVAKLDPDMNAFLQTIARWSKNRGFDESSLSVEKLRSLSRSLREDFQPPLTSDLELLHGTYETRRGKLRYTAVSWSDRLLGRCPLGLYFFGGGFVASGIEQALNEAARIARAIKGTVVIADYRLAPEYPFPACLEDAYDALTWCCSHSQELGCSTKGINIYGCSAGGNIAVVTALRSLQSGECEINSIGLLCPALDLVLDDHSSSAYATGFGFDRTEMMFYVDQYLQGADPAQELTSPARFAVPTGFPKTALLIAECDLLRDGAIRFANAVQDAGSPATVLMASGMSHAFNLFPEHIPSSRMVLREFGEVIETYCK